MGRFFGVAICIALVWFGYSRYQERTKFAQLDASPRTTAPEVPDVAVAPERNLTPGRSVMFKCDGRIYCAQMTSCAEATFFIQQCPGTQMDGDNDGIPCERQWCN